MTDNTTPPVEGPKALSKVEVKTPVIEKISLWVRRLTWVGIIGLPLFYAVAALGTRWGWWSIIDEPAGRLCLPWIGLQQFRISSLS